MSYIGKGSVDKEIGHYGPRPLKEDCWVKAEQADKFGINGSGNKQYDVCRY